MGEYFDWVNLTKHQILDGLFWDDGAPKLHESSWVGCQYTDAVLTLLAGDWAGDRVVLLGDYWNCESEANPKLAPLAADMAGRCVDDYEEDLLEDVSGRFREVKEQRYFKRREWEAPWGPEEGWPDFADAPCDLAIRGFRYVINDAEREYVDRWRTPVRWMNEREIVRYDPIPELMSSAYPDPEFEDGSTVCGRWALDPVRPSDTPPEGHTPICQTYTYWPENGVLTCDDETIRDVIRTFDIDCRASDAKRKVIEALGANGLQ